MSYVYFLNIIPRLLSDEKASSQLPLGKEKLLTLTWGWISNFVACRPYTCAAYSFILW